MNKILGEYCLEAPCACQKGAVKTKLICKIDENNELLYEKICEEIVCDNCSKIYHIETIFHPTLLFNNCLHYQTFLVPNDLQLILPPEKQSFDFDFYETVVSEYSYEEIVEMMKNISKCTNSMQLQSREYHIAELHRKQNKSIALKNIIQSLQICLDNYYQYQWTKDVYEEFRKTENDNIIQAKNKLIEAVNSSYYVQYGINPLYEQKLANKIKVIYI